MTWKQLEESGCPVCGCPLSDMVHQSDGTLTCGECVFEIHDSEILGWIAGKSVCRVCGTRGVFVAPEICDLDYMECGNCHNMTCEKI